MQLRLAAQGTAGGIIGLGGLYNIYTEATSKKSKS